MPLASRPKGLRQSRPPVRVAASRRLTRVLGQWLAGSSGGAARSQTEDVGGGAVYRTCCATVGAGVELRSDDLDDADWAAVRLAEQPAQIEARSTTEQKKLEAGQLHVPVLVRAPGPSKERAWSWQCRRAGCV